MEPHNCAFRYTWNFWKASAKIQSCAPFQQGSHSCITVSTGTARKSLQNGMKEERFPLAMISKQSLMNLLAASFAFVHKWKRWFPLARKSENRRYLSMKFALQLNELVWLRSFVCHICWKWKVLAWGNFRILHFSLTKYETLDTLVTLKFFYS